MGYERPKSFNVHDPLGLIAMPMAPMTAGLENSVVDYPKLITDGGQSTGVPTAVRTIGGALITALVLVGLVAPPRPATVTASVAQHVINTQTPSQNSVYRSARCRTVSYVKDP